MKGVTLEMINEFGLRKLKYDFAGYTFVRTNELSFHHTVIAHRDCKRLGVPCDGYIRTNGSILNQKTSHDYLHRIERVDPEIFYLITAELIDENLRGKIDIQNLRRIRDLLLYFEREHDHDRMKSGHPLIKREYVERRIKL